MRHATERFLIDSTPATRCLLGIAVGSPLLCLAWAAIALGQLSPEIAAHTHATALHWAHACLATALSVLAAMGVWLWPRRQDKAERFWAELVVALGVGMPFTYLNGLSGLYGSGNNLILLGAATIGLLLLNWRVMLVGITICGLWLIGWDWLTWHEAVPYAGAILPSTFHNEQPAWWWRLWQGLTLYIGLPVAVTMIMMLFASHDALRRKLAQLAITDALTGLANRRHFMDRLAQELARQRRAGRVLTVVSIDADHFKQINDLHGHAKGDEALVMLSHVLSVGIRAPTDLAARLGGEEFALLLPDTSLEEAQVVCRRLQSALTRRSIDTGTGALHLTVSMGLVQALGASAQAILKASDTNLYQAKASGRNCMVCSALEAPLSSPARHESPPGRQQMARGAP
jgi:diguanylate cyclase (GGDEF)-like protein